MRTLILTACIVICAALGGCDLDAQEPGPDAGTPACGLEGEKCCPVELSPDGEPDWCAEDLECGAVERGLCG